MHLLPSSPLVGIPARNTAMVRRILIADDNAVIRRTLRDLFRQESDFEVCGQCENGQEAVEKAQELHPDLIVLDLSMPVMNGLKTISRQTADAAK